MIRTRVKLAATLTVVVLALTGFHTGSHGSSSSSGGGGKSKSGKSRSHGHSDDDSGGGCSSDEKSNDDYDGSGGSGGSDATVTASPSPTSPRVEVVVVDCVKPAQNRRKGKPARKADTTATLRITSDEATEGTYRVTLEFKGATGSAVDSAEAVVTVGSYTSKTFEVAMKTPKTVGQVKNCWVYDVREQERAPGSATAS
ncbi:hypothetical protein ABT154_27555 [Streptomyces sp. NPDC001728]|uniref:hypothetical protein n=1 Tax=Streptomyces sp. NPDC001728 TaxID=3154396 RepID=UPI00332B5A4D